MMDFDQSGETHPLPPILWRRLDFPGYESARLFTTQQGWLIKGTAVFVPTQGISRLAYQINCDRDWQARFAIVEGWVGQSSVEVKIEVQADQTWLLNGKPIPAVMGCVDLDLNFSPVTNMLPIRRLNLAVGQSAQVRAAWLRFPGFELEPLSQTYRRISSTTYRYESTGGSFSADLRVNALGFVVDYPPIWIEEKGSS